MHGDLLELQAPLLSLLDTQDGRSLLRRLPTRARVLRMCRCADGKYVQVSWNGQVYRVFATDLENRSQAVEDASGASAGAGASPVDLERRRSAAEDASGGGRVADQFLPDRSRIA